jgi:hypothetical protein
MALIDDAHFLFPGGEGDRTGLVTVTTNSSLGGGTINNFVDGAIGANDADSFWHVNAQTGRWIKFDFGSPKFISRFLVRIVTSGTGANLGSGTWRVEGSHDDSSWLPLSGSAPLIAGQIHPIDTTIANVNAYRYFRLVQEGAGTTGSSYYWAECYFAIADPSGEANVAPTTATVLGSGNRVGAIAVTSGSAQGALFNAATGHSTIINGTAGNENWFLAGRSDAWVKFGFPIAVCITEATWFQDIVATHGVWKWQGSNNDVDWTDIGATFTLGSPATQVIAELNGNTVRYLYYKLVQISGLTSSGPYTREINFKMGATTQAAVPTIVHVDPAKGNVAGGTTVTISGAGFTGATGVLFGADPATAVVVDNDNTIICKTPAHAAGVVDITIQHPEGDIIGAGLFEYIDVVLSDPVRLTQLPVLVLDNSPQPSRLTQLALLVLNLPKQPNRVTQLPVLALDTPQPIPLPRPVVPEVPVTEIWSWKTVLSISEGSREQRAALRQYPRYSMRINALILSEADRRDVFQLLFKFIDREMLYPFYQYSAVITADAVAGSSNLLFDVARTDLRNGETVALFDPQMDETHYLTLGVVNAGGATLAKPLGFSVPAGWLVCPAIPFRVPVSVGLNMRALDGSLTLAMESTRPRAFQRPGAAPGLVMLDGMPVLHNRPLANDVDEELEQNVEWLDNETSIPIAATNWPVPFVSGKRTYVLKRPADMDYWRGLADALRGRQNPFLLPTFRDDLPLSAVPVLNTAFIETSNIQYFTFWRQKAYQYIRIASANGFIYRRVLEAICNYDAMGNPLTVTLKLNNSIGNVAGDNVIDRVSFMYICRLNSDDITLTHGQLDTTLTLEFRAVNE